MKAPAQPKVLWELELPNAPHHPERYWKTVAQGCIAGRVRPEFSMEQSGPTFKAVLCLSHPRSREDQGDSVAFMTIARKQPTVDAAKRAFERYVQRLHLELSSEQTPLQEIIEDLVTRKKKQR